MDEVQQLREGVAMEYGIALYRRYSEPEAAHFLQIDLTTLKRMRRAGKVPYVALGERQIRYLGIHIVDLIAFGDKWKTTNSQLENTPSPDGEAPTSITVSGTTQPQSALTASQWAQETFKSRS